MLSHDSYGNYSSIADKKGVHILIALQQNIFKIRLINKTNKYHIRM